MKNYMCYKNFPIFISFTPFSRISLLSCLFVPHILIHPPPSFIAPHQYFQSFLTLKNFSFLSLSVKHSTTWTAWHLKLKPMNSPVKSLPIGCPETSVTNYQPTTRSFPQRSGSLKSDWLKKLKNVSVISCPQWILHVSYGCHNATKVRIFL